MNLFFFFNITQRLEPFFLIIWPSRIEPFWKIWLKGLNFFKCDLEPRIILQFDSNNWIWLKALNPPFQYDSKNWTLFWTWLTETYWVIITQRIVLSKNMTHKTQRIEPSFHKWLEDLTFLFQICLIEITFFFEKKMTRRIDFLKISIKLYKLYFDDSKNWAFFFFFLKNMTHRNWTFFTWLKELNPFLNMTQRIEKFSWFFDSKNWTFFEYDSKMWIFLECDSQNWTFLSTQRNEFFFQNDKDFVEYDSKNRTFVWICPKELNLFWNFTQWIEHSAQKDSKNWTLKDYLNNKTFLWIGELGLFFYLTQRIEPFLKYHSKIIDLFLTWHSLFRTWLTELIFFFFLKNMTHWDWTLLFFLSQRKWLHF